MLRPEKTPAQVAEMRERFLNAAMKPLGPSGPAGLSIRKSRQKLSSGKERLGHRVLSTLQGRR